MTITVILVGCALLVIAGALIGPKALRKYRCHRDFKALRNRAAAMKKFGLSDLHPTRDSRE